MKKFVIVIVVFLIALYFWMQFKKKKAKTDIPLNNTNSESNAANVRQDSSTAKDVIDSNAGNIEGSSTSNNPITRENNNPIPLADHLSEVSIISSIPVKPILSPDTVVVSSNGALTNQPNINNVQTLAGQGIVAVLPNIGDQVSNSALWSNIAVGNGTWNWLSVDGKLSFIADANGKRLS